MMARRTHRRCFTPTISRHKPKPFIPTYPTFSPEPCHGPLPTSANAGMFAALIASTTLASHTQHPIIQATAMAAYSERVTEAEKEAKEFETNQKRHGIQSAAVIIANARAASRAVLVARELADPNQDHEDEEGGKRQGQEQRHGRASLLMAAAPVILGQPAAPGVASAHNASAVANRRARLRARPPAVANAAARVQPQVQQPAAAIPPASIPPAANAAAGAQPQTQQPTPANPPAAPAPAANEPTAFTPTARALAAGALIADVHAQNTSRLFNDYKFRFEGIAPAFQIDPLLKRKHRPELHSLRRREAVAYEHILNQFPLPLSRQLQLQLHMQWKAACRSFYATQEWHQNIRGIQSRLAAALNPVAAGQWALRLNKRVQKKCVSAWLAKTHRPTKATGKEAPTHPKPLKFRDLRAETRFADRFRVQLGSKRARWNKTKLQHHLTTGALIRAHLSGPSWGLTKRGSGGHVLTPQLQALYRNVQELHRDEQTVHQKAMDDMLQQRQHSLEIWSWKVGEKDPTMMADHRRRRNQFYFMRPFLPSFTASSKAASQQPDFTGSVTALLQTCTKEAFNKPQTEAVQQQHDDSLKEFQKRLGALQQQKERINSSVDLWRQEFQRCKNTMWALMSKHEQNKMQAKFDAFMKAARQEFDGYDLEFQQVKIQEKRYKLEWEKSKPQLLTQLQQQQLVVQPLGAPIQPSALNNHSSFNASGTVGSITDDDVDMDFDLNSPDDHVKKYKYIPLHINPGIACTLATMNLDAAMRRLPSYQDSLIARAIYQNGFDYISQCIILSAAGKASASNQLYPLKSFFHPLKQSLLSQAGEAAIRAWTYKPKHDDPQTALTLAMLDMEHATLVDGHSFCGTLA
ncbi:hypothetical protein BGW39_000691 [Mortierella sp. 14UC]|nr:hypothetical protein BGW39_000691 [Mortierella sp. 14UC]